MKHTLLTITLLIFSQFLWADKTFDSLFTRLSTRADLYVEDTTGNAPVEPLLVYLQQHADSGDIRKWVAKAHQQKNYFIQQGNEKIYALLALAELQLYDNFSWYLSKAGRDSIVREAETFLPLLKKHKLTNQYAMGFVFLGRYYFTQNENKSFTYFLMALSQKSSVYWVNSFAAFNIGTIYRRGGNYQKAIEYGKLGMQYDSTNRDIFCILSFYHAHLHQCDSAARYLHLAQVKSDTNSVYYTRAKAYYFLCFNQYDSALHYIQNCISHYDSQPVISNTFHYLIYFNRDLYRIYKLQHQTKKQQQALDKIRYYSLNHQFDLMGIQAATMGFEVLEQDAFEKHDFENAYFYRTRLDALRDSSEKLGALNVYESIQVKNTYEEKLTTYEQEAQQKEEAARQKLQQQKRIAFFAGIVLVFLALLAFVQFRNNKKVKKERDRSDNLLLNILPAEVAEELKTKGSADARLFDDVTVLFTDFKSFTRVSERLTPQQLVDELNVCFSAFDGIMAKHNIEKIKTVGDAYLAVSGLPLPATTHATDAVNAAIEIREFIKQRRAQKGDDTFDIRIGIHTGSVVAGIVGVKKFAYDIWGDTVNTAARMEQNSEPGKINISEATYALVKGVFTCTYRGEIEAKNKGKLKMYFVESS